MNLRNIFKVVVLTAFLSFSINESVAAKKAVVSANTFENPDFAFPRDVQNNATARLKSALAKKNNIEALQAAVQISVSTNLVSRDSVQTAISLLSRLSNQLPAPYSSLSSLLEARLYRDIFNANSWNYRNRTVAKDSADSDPFLWDKHLFAEKVQSLVARAFSNKTGWDKPIADFAPLIESDSLTRSEGYLLYDFITNQSINLLNTFYTTSPDATIPFFAGNQSASSFTPISLAKELVDFHNSLSKPSVALGCAMVKLSQLDNSYKLEKYIDDASLGIARLPIAAQFCSNGFAESDRDNAPTYYNILLKLRDEYGEEGRRWLNAVIGNMEAKQSDISMPELITPYQNAELKVSRRNVRDGECLIYRLPNNLNFDRPIKVSQVLSKGTLCHTMVLPIVENKNQLPFIQNDTLQLPAVPPGRYAILFSGSEALSESQQKENASLFNVSAIDIIIQNGTVNNAIYVVDSSTAAPVKGATVQISQEQGYRKPRITRQYVTDASGKVTPPANFRWCNIKAEYKGSIIDSDFGLYQREKAPINDLDIEVLTDLALYHPGDKVQFALISYQSDGKSTHLSGGRQIEATLRDANYQQVDTCTLITDDEGRAWGSFTLPSQGLRGRWIVEANYKIAQSDDRANCHTGSAAFEVADYKAPTFFAAFDNIPSPLPVGDTLNVKGKTLTYSGMGVADADVRYTITYSPWRFARYGGNSATFSGNVSTDPDGNFSIALPTDNLKNTRYERGTFRITATVTSQAGETQQAPSKLFSFAPFAQITPEIPSQIALDSDTLSLKVKVSDLQDFPQRKTINYTLYHLEGEKKARVQVMSGVFESPVLKIHAARLASGRYEVDFSLAEDSLSTANAEFILYRLTDRRPPVRTSLWLPQKNVIAKDKQKKVKIKALSSYPDNYLLCTVSDSEGNVTTSWLRPSDGYFEKEVAAPSNNGRVWVTFTAVNDFVRNTQTAEVLPASANTRLDVAVESMKEKNLAGSHQHWKFRYALAGKPAADIPVMAVMSNKALDAITPFVWQFNPRNSLRMYCPVTIDGIWSGNIYRQYSFGNQKVAYYNMATPEWNMYGYNLFGYGSGRSTRYYADSNGEVVMTEMALASAPAMMKSAKTENAADTDGDMEVFKATAADNEMVVVEDSRTPSDVSDDSDVKWRNSECPLAFFMPDLSTDAYGNLLLDFDMPDFNTTWRLQMLAYTPDLFTSKSEYEAIASRPVMVQSNLPQFFRTGDKIALRATLFNNTDTQLPISAEIRIVNPLTHQTIAFENFPAREVAPSASDVVETTFTVPSDLNTLIVRMMARSGDNSDAEETVLPVLPSSQPVIESTPFWLSAQQKEFTMNLPELKESDSLTVQFSDDPMWTCVTALPDIISPETESVWALADALYGNAVGMKLMKSHPSLRRALEDALASPQDSLLVSNLEKNTSLKAVALNNTPWVNNASSETLRMMRLSSLLDDADALQKENEVWKHIEKLHNSDGGWSWYPGMRSSLFMTENVLSRLAMLRGLDISPEVADYDKAVADAIRYCDKEYLELFAKKQHPAYASLLHYLYIRSALAKAPSSFDALKKKGLDAIAAGWKNMDVRDKATAAILLGREGKRDVALQILSSLSQYSSYSAEKGRWWANLKSGFDGSTKLLTTTRVLEAVNELQPDDEEIDQIRQWLLLQRSVEDWGGIYGTAETIYALLASGSDWTPSAPKGDVSIQVSDGVLKVSRQSDGPAWGAVIRSYVAPMEDVKAASVPDLKIEKKFYRVSIENDKETLTETENFKVGDKIRVSINLKNDLDMNYIAIIDERPSAFLPNLQISDYLCIDSLWGYKEVRDARTSFFFSFLPKGSHVISYDCYVAQEGEFASGVASVQSQYTPAMAAHSSGSVITVEK